MILIKWFNYKKIVLKFPILCGYWRYHLIFFHPPRARVFLFRFLINEFCELRCTFSRTFWNIYGESSCSNCKTVSLHNRGFMNHARQRGMRLLHSLDGRMRQQASGSFTCYRAKFKGNYGGGRRRTSGAPNDNFRKNICSEDDLRSRIFGTFVVKFLACLPLLGFSNI